MGAAEKGEKEVEQGLEEDAVVGEQNRRGSRNSKEWETGAGEEAVAGKGV